MICNIVKGEKIDAARLVKLETDSFQDCHSCQQWYPAYRLGLGAVEEVGIDLGGADVGVAHQLLHREDGHVVGQQRHAEGVSGGVERYVLPHVGIATPVARKCLGRLKGQ